MSVILFQEPKKSAAEEITSGLFDTRTKIFKNALFSCLGLLLFFLACGLIWDYGYKRHYKKNTTEFGTLLPHGYLFTFVALPLKTTVYAVLPNPPLSTERRIILF